MTSYLLAINIGPVQEFISAARRTRDLWFGSELLSEISRAAATAIAEHGSLIFPANVEVPNIANVILAEVHGPDPVEIAEAAKAAARQKWLAVANNVRESIPEQAVRVDTWKNQIGDVIEVYAAWVPRSSSYQDDRRRLNRLMAGRKNARDFKSAFGEAGVPKSSLDGQRESVLAKAISDSIRKQLRLSAGERLDAVGLVKRQGFGTQTYPSVARVAADPWVQGAEKLGILPELVNACEKLEANGLRRLRGELYSDFPYEGTVIYKDRHPDLIAETALTKNDLKPVADIVKGTPSPYLAVLVADGDRMGEKLALFGDPNEHRAFSEKLASFANDVAELIAHHRGILVYAGGDDVLAFLPVNSCLECANDLRKQFHEITEATLSVGIGIGHFMENLEDLLDYGRTAEKAAKASGRNALAIHLHKRGGAPIRVASPWTADLHGHLAAMADLITRKKLSGRVAYDLRRMADLYREWNDPKDAIQRDVNRMLAAKKPGGGDSETSAIQTLVENRVKDSETLDAFARELLIARLLSEVQRQADGKGEVE